MIKLKIIKHAFIAVCISIIGLTVFPFAAFSQANYTEIRDAIPIRGTEYLIRFPENWNGTLISDLDYRRATDSPLYTRLLADGFALSGTNRRPERLILYI